MDCFAARGAGRGGDGKERAGVRVGAREEDAGFFEEFADRARAVGKVVFVAVWVGGGAGQRAV